MAITLFIGLPVASCAGDGGSTQENKEIASASDASLNPHMGFAVLAQEMGDAGLRGDDAGASPVVSFGAVEAGFKRKGDGESINQDRPNQDGLHHETAAAGYGGAGVAEAGSIASDGDRILSYTSKNSYPDITWSPWSHLAEPYRETTLRADSTLGDLDNDVFVWTMPGENGASFEGRYVVYVRDAVVCITRYIFVCCFRRNLRSAPSYLGFIENTCVCPRATDLAAVVSSCYPLLCTSICRFLLLCTTYL